MSDRARLPKIAQVSVRICISDNASTGSKNPALLSQWKILQIAPCHKSYALLKDTGHVRNGNAMAMNRQSLGRTHRLSKKVLVLA